MANTIDNMNSCGVSWFKFDEASGNVTDSKGTAVGTVTGATRVAGYNGMGSALNFDGSDYVQFNQKVIPIGAKSIRFKIKTTQNVSNPSFPCVFDTRAGNTSSGGGIICLVYQGKIDIAIWYNGGLKSLIYPIADGQWHDVLFTWDGTNSVNGMKLYIDDMVTPKVTNTYNLGGEVHSNNLQFGTFSTSTLSYYFIGQIDEFEIYDKVISPIPDKTLILHNGVYKYYTTSWQTIGATVTESDYITNGMVDISVIPESAWQELSGTVELCYYTDDTAKTEASFNIETEPFTLADEFANQEIKVIEYTDNPSQEESVTTIETDPFSFYEEMGDSFDVLYYTDDTAKTSAELEINANYSPLDELDGDFDVVTWTNESEPDAPDILARTLQMNALPLGQIVVSDKDIMLYGSLKQAIATRFEEVDKKEGVIRTLISFDSGVKWESFKNGTWSSINVLDINSITQSGMTLSELENIPDNEFSESYDTIRFAYYIEEHIRDIDSAKIDKVELKQSATFNTPEISDMSFYVLNTLSTINLTLTGRDLDGKISDVDRGKVRYRVFLNGQPYFPLDGEYTGFEATPLDIALTLDGTQVLMGQENSLTVEFEDYWGSTDSWTTTFIGQYYGLIFEDPLSNAYATDIGQVLQYLDVGTLIAGQKSSEFEIYLHNTHGYTVENPTISSYTEHSAVTIELSKTTTPFVASDKLLFEQQLLDGEKIKFYMRLATSLTTPPVMGGIFELRVNADKVEE